MKRHIGLKLAVILAFALIPFGFAQMGMSDQGHTNIKPLLTMPGGEVVEGTSAQLIRTDNRISITIHSKGLVPGDVYTVWWVLFNNPGACSAAPDGDPSVPHCGPDDIHNAEGLNLNALARISSLYTVGNIADANGEAMFSAALDVGDPLGMVHFGPNIEAPEDAWVRLVIRTHGPPVMERLHAQLNLFEDDCDACANVQSVDFPPP